MACTLDDFCNKLGYLLTNGQRQDYYSVSLRISPLRRFRVGGLPCAHFRHVPDAVQYALKACSAPCVDRSPYFGSGD